jgi:hypothetical protein
VDPGDPSKPWTVYLPNRKAAVAFVLEHQLVAELVFTQADRLGFKIRSVEIEEPNLEAVFLHLTGRALRD